MSLPEGYLNRPPTLCSHAPYSFSSQHSLQLAVLYLFYCLMSVATRREKAPRRRRTYFVYHSIYRTQCRAWFVAEQVEAKRHLLIIYNFVGEILWSTTKNFSKRYYMVRVLSIETGFLIIRLLSECYFQSTAVPNDKVFLITVTSIQSV